MKRIALIGLLLLGPVSAFAADNAVVVTAGSGITMKSKDIGAGVQAMQPILSDITGQPIYGTAGTSNSNVATVQGIAGGTPMPVSLTSVPSHAVTNAGTFAVQVTSAPSTAVTNAGTFATQSTQAGTWTVQPGNTANTTAWLVTGTGGTFPVTQGTAANLNATVVGTGTFAVQAASTLAAETTKVIGVVRAADGAGNLLTSTANALDVNIKSGGNANGNAVMASSSPTTMASDQRVSTANATTLINMSSATTTQLVALSGSTSIYVTSYRVMASGTGTFALVYGTGTNCATGLTTIDGPFSLTAQAGLAPGSGVGSIVTIPSGKALCVTTTGAGTWNGSVTTQQF